jgi:hypothetical protein
MPFVTGKSQLLEFFWKDLREVVEIYGFSNKANAKALAKVSSRVYGRHLSSL